MRKFSAIFLAGCLLLLLPSTTWASEETTYESEIPLLPELTGLQPTLPPVLLPITPDLPYASIRDIRAAGLI